MSTPAPSPVPSAASAAEAVPQSPFALVFGDVLPPLGDVPVDIRVMPVVASVKWDTHGDYANVVFPLEAGNQVVVGGETFAVKALHLHTPSEHTLNGRRFDGVAHFVCESATGEKSVLAVFLDASSPQAGQDGLFARLAEGIPAPSATEGAALSGAVDIREAFPARADGGHPPVIRTTGSLTTPSNAERNAPVKHWMFFEEPAQISAATLQALQQKLGSHTRALQDAAGRNESLTRAPVSVQVALPEVSAVEDVVPVPAPAREAPAMPSRPQVSGEKKVLFVVATVALGAVLSTSATLYLGLPLVLASIVGGVGMAVEDYRHKQGGGAEVSSKGFFTDNIEKLLIGMGLGDRQEQLVRQVQGQELAV